jgi:hypothetical protein
MIPSVYQQAIYDFQESGSGDAFVSACAGSGKTTVLVELAKRLPLNVQRSAVFVAFNKHIAEELKTRLPAGVRAATIHSLGMAALRNHIRPGRAWRVEGTKYQKIIRAWYAENGVSRFDKGAFEAFDSMAELTKLAMLTLTNPADSLALARLAAQYDIKLTDPEKQFRALPTILEWGVKGMPYPDERGCRWSMADGISFDDMVYLPIRLNLPVEQYDMLYTDECLPYKTPVLLADGGSLEIGDIVENRRDVEVLGFDTATGEQKPCRVTGWSKTPNRKPLVKIRASRRVSRNTVTSDFVVCTTDHEIWVTRGGGSRWVEAGQVMPGDVVQVETAAKKSQTYKITVPGKRTLAQEMSAKNEDGRVGVHGNSHGPRVRGGNGRGQTVPQQALMSALGDGWEPELVVPTGLHSSGYPTHYKCDIANPQALVVVEVDGPSHSAASRRAQDERKQEFLESKGWRVFRVSNREAFSDPVAVASRIIETTLRGVESGCDAGPDSCPVDATVTSVDPVELDDYFVYDITVEGCHDFYANGILVHNCQDLNAAQLEFVLKMRSGRAFFVGDPKQAIYHFCGAGSDSVETIIRRTGATVLPLSICYRCPKSHIALAQSYVPTIEHAPDAGEGVTGEINYHQVSSAVKTGDLVLCRCTAPLIKLVFELLRAKIPAKVRGRDIGASIIKLIDTVESLEDYSWEGFAGALEVYRARQLTLLQKADDGVNDARIEGLNDRVESLLVIHEQLVSEGRCSSAADLRAFITDLFRDDNAPVMLSTIHKAKGLEADRVFILRFDLMPHPMAKTPASQAQEKHLQYIAVTRARRELFFIQEDDKKPARILS